MELYLAGQAQLSEELIVNAELGRGPTPHSVICTGKRSYRKKEFRDIGPTLLLAKDAEQERRKHWHEPCTGTAPGWDELVIKRLFKAT